MLDSGHDKNYLPLAPYSLELECRGSDRENGCPPTTYLEGRLVFRGTVGLHQGMVVAELAQKTLSKLYADEGFVRTEEGAEAFAERIRTGDPIPGLEELIREETRVFSPMLFDEDWGSWFPITYVSGFEK